MTGEQTPDRPAMLAAEILAEMNARQLRAGWRPCERCDRPVREDSGVDSSHLCY